MRTKHFAVNVLTGAMLQAVPAEGRFTREPLLPNLLTGVEIEAENVEGNSTAVEGYGWRVDEDGSLRYGGREWVLDRPLAGKSLASAIDLFYDKLEADEFSYTPSPRAGTHIHINVSDQKFGVVQAIGALMYCIDQLVFEWVDYNRMWCSYCNSMNTLPADALRTFFDDRDHQSRRVSIWTLNTNDRYYGFNVASLFKYGTLEFRYFPTTTERSDMWNWLDFCHLVFAAGQRFAEAAGEEDNIALRVLEAFRTNPEATLVSVFGDVDGVISGLTRNERFADIIREAAEELELFLSIDTSDTWVEHEPEEAVPSLIDGLTSAEERTAISYEEHVRHMQALLRQPRAVIEPSPEPHPIFQDWGGVAPTIASTTRRADEPLV